MTAIASSGEDSIRRSINVSPVLNLSENYEHYFEIQKCVRWIVDNNYERVSSRVFIRLLIVIPYFALKRSAEGFALIWNSNNFFGVV